MPAYTRVLNDPAATAIGTEAWHEKRETGQDGDSKLWSDPRGVIFGIGRGVTDPLVTYVFLERNAIKTYVYINATNDGLIVTTVQP